MRINESPDNITVGGHDIHYRNVKYPQRSFVIFRNHNVWIGSVGESHDDIYDKEGSIPDMTALTGRVWPTLGIISFWHNPISNFGKDYRTYMSDLASELARYKIDVTKLKVDMYGMWGIRYKDILDDNLYDEYHSSSNTVTRSWEEFLSLNDAYIRAGHHLKKDPKKDKPSGSSYGGSSLTSWDSPHNIVARQAMYTSESFYPSLMNEMKSDDVLDAMSNVRDDFTLRYDDIDKRGHSVMLKTDKGRVTVYWYDDDDETVYISNLKVDKKSRKKGVGTDLMNMAENTAFDLGANTIYIWARKSSWMHDWYERLGYVDFKDHKNKGMIWMKKMID